MRHEGIPLNEIKKAKTQVGNKALNSQLVRYFAENEKTNLIKLRRIFIGWRAEITNNKRSQQFSKFVEKYVIRGELAHAFNIWSMATRVAAGKQDFLKEFVVASKSELLNK